MDPLNTHSVLVKALSDSQSRVQELEELLRERETSMSEMDSLKVKLRQSKELNEAFRAELASLRTAQNVKKEDSINVFEESKLYQQMSAQLEASNKERDEATAQVEANTQMFIEKTDRFRTKKRNYKEKIKQLEEQLKSQDPSSPPSPANDTENSHYSPVPSPEPELLQQPQINLVIREYLSGLPAVVAPAMYDKSRVPVAAHMNRNQLIQLLQFTISERYWSPADIFFFPGRTYRASPQQHVMAFTVATQMIPNSDHRITSNFERLRGETGELFIAENNNIFYAGRCKAIDLAHLAPAGCKLFRALSLRKLVDSAYPPGDIPHDYPSRDALSGMIKAGQLSLDVIGLQCIGFDSSVYQKLSDHYNNERNIKFQLNKRKSVEAASEASASSHKSKRFKV
ncbi:hypothetical protein D9758_004933 [Tetrapyrgos nigripes]|uniref:Uncharacterized protein n=1 Tax=Tetrapyrgos nigripes TaxID=182062 RepID=A0A8H5LWT1_9AGAR|nr:hypothetical protein D9758_004933 [Tetrapyrgos nigripes]